MVNESDLSAALAELSIQKKPNYSATARKYGIERTTLMRRHKGKTKSRQWATDVYHKKLTNGQEKRLIEESKFLTSIGFPPPHRKIKKLVANATKTGVGGRWVSRFIKRYEDQIRSAYVKPIDRKRQLADRVEKIENWFERVCSCHPTTTAFCANSTSS